jgi:HlyD family secretion protein
LREIEVKKADIESIDNKISEASLTAPQDGMIIEKLSETSEVVGAASSIAVLANLKDVWVRGYIPEEDMGKIKIGQKADIISDSFKDKTYAGYFSYISPEAEFTPKNVQTKRERVKLVYRVKINVDNSSRELKLGMPVDVKIKCDL